MNCVGLRGSPQRLLWIVLFSMLAQVSVCTVVAQTVWHVDAQRGSDQSNGLSQTSAFATIQHGIDRAQPGDTVLIQGGVYAEFITLKRPGRQDAPIRIRADRVAADHVILTGANPQIRQKRQAWACVDPALLLYRTPLESRPTRVLADRVDLLAYSSLADLKALWFLKSDYPGHPHGFAWDEQERMLYVRLRADRKYNPSTDPNALTMAVSPPTGGGDYGHIGNRPDNYNLTIPFSGSAHVIIDGLTFETPGIAGVFTQASDVTVRNSWFYGCRAAVAAPEDKEAEKQAHRVTIEQCVYTQFPAFTDAMETLSLHAETERAKKEDYHKIMHWQRKGAYPPGDGVDPRYGYEVGLTVCMGTGWIIRNNLITEAIDGICAAGSRYSRDTVIISNRFDRLCDNAVEAEPHSRNLIVANNLIIDTFEPFSWQPQAGEPLPGPIYIYDNVVWQTPENVAFWEKAHYWSGIVKVGSSERRWKKLYKTPQVITIPGGLWLVHNTIIVPRGRLLTPLNQDQWPMKGLNFLNNIIAVWRLVPQSRYAGLSTYVFDYNLVWPSMPQEDGSVDTNLVMAAGAQGRWIERAHTPDDWSHPLQGIADVPVGLTGDSARRDPWAIPAVLPLRNQVGAATLTLNVGPQTDDEKQTPSIK